MPKSRTGHHRGKRVRNAQRAFARGQRDFERNVSFYSCPYAELRAAEEWQRGWRSALAKATTHY